MDVKQLYIDDKKWELSLSKLAGRKVVDVGFYISEIDGEASAILTDIYFEDGSRIGVGGTYDTPYLERSYKSSPPNLDDETLATLRQELDAQEVR